MVKLIKAGYCKIFRGGNDSKILAEGSLMKIAIDARMIHHDSMHGIARYVDELLSCLAAQSYNHDFFVFISKNSPLLRKKWPDFINLIPVKAKWISFREQWELPSLLKRLRVDLFHAPSFVAPIFCPSKLVMTIHDLNHMVLPQYYTPLHQFYYHAFVRSCIKSSELILTVSHFSKHEIIRNLAIDPAKIFVTYNGVSKNYRPVENDEQIRYVRDIYELPKRFVFCLSNNKPHKNVHQLVRAFSESKIDIPLVLTCTPDSHLIRIAETFGKKHLLYFSKFIADEHLPSVYTMTDLFVYPSTYEGFGLPPLEAAACGASVAVARSSSLPEVVGEYAIFLDPYDYVAMARTLEEALLNPPSLERKRQGMEYASRFSWEKMAEDTLVLYERCLWGDKLLDQESDKVLSA